MSSIEFYKPGEEVDPEEVLEGDFILTHGNRWTSKLIRFGQSLRYPKNQAYFNHAALVIDTEGNLAEAFNNGVVRNHLDWYKDSPYYYIKIKASGEDRKQMMDYANAVLEARWKYSWLTILSIIPSLILGRTVWFATSGSAICSGFVAEALVRTGVVFPEAPHHTMPAGLAKFYGVFHNGSS